MSKQNTTTKIKAVVYCKFSRYLLAKSSCFVYIIKMNEHSLISVFLILSLGLTTSCSSVEPPKVSEIVGDQAVANSNTSNKNLNLTEFNRNKKLWEKQEIKNYRIRLEASGFLRPFPNPILVEVENSKIKKIKSLDKKTDYVKAYDEFNTIDKIFDFIQSEITNKADKLNVRFDEKLGYPVQIALDEKVGRYDDELSLKVISFEIKN